MPSRGARISGWFSSQAAQSFTAEHAEAAEMVPCKNGLREFRDLSGPGIIVGPQLRAARNLRGENLVQEAV
jgi:hypothetical protein